MSEQRKIQPGDLVRSPEDNGKHVRGVVVRVVRTPVAPGKASHEEVYVRWGVSA